MYSVGTLQKTRDGDAGELDSNEAGSLRNICQVMFLIDIEVITHSVAVGLAASNALLALAVQKVVGDWQMSVCVK